MNATEQEPSVVGVRVRPFWSMVLFALLVASAALALWAQRTPGAPVGLAQTGPWVFLAFTVGFAAYRIALVSARRYSAFKAFIQIGMAALFFMLLIMPNALPGLPVSGPGSQVELSALLADSNARVRALAAEVAGFRGEKGSAPALTKLLSDAEPSVRAAAHQALVRLNAGADLGTTSADWEGRFQ